MPSFQLWLRNSSKYHGEVGFKAARLRSGGVSNCSNFAMLRRGNPVRCPISLQGKPLISERMDGGENLVPRRPVREAGLQKASGCGDLVGVGQQRPAGRTAVKVHLLLDSLPQVLHDMKPVGDLFRLRRSFSGGLGVETAAIPAYDFHLRMTP